MRLPNLTAVTLAALMAFPVAPGPIPGASRANAEPTFTHASRARPAPIKDCTRFNGRFGYYGNLWCTEREQLIWDLHTSGRRFGRR